MASERVTSFVISFPCPLGFESFENAEPPAGREGSFVLGAEHEAERQQDHAPAEVTDRWAVAASDMKTKISNHQADPQAGKKVPMR
jgi:hypothetical protein